MSENEKLVERLLKSIGRAGGGAVTQPDMQRVCEALGFDPTNHHNAAKCPYCNDGLAAALTAAEARIKMLSEALKTAIEALDVYADPTGYNDNSGDPYETGSDSHPGVGAACVAAEVRQALTHGASDAG